MTELAELFDAIARDEAGRLRTLLDATPALARRRNEHGLTPLMYALYHRRPALAAIILEAGAEPDAFELAALGAGDEVAASLDAQPDRLHARSPDGFTLLHLAAFFNHLPLVRQLIERGADVNARADNPSRVAPLHSAAAARSEPIVAFLLARGAEPDLAQHGGWTALHAAAMHGDTAMVGRLLEHHADVSLKSDEGKTARDLAVEHDHDEVADLLAPA